MTDFDNKIAALENKRKPLFAERDALNDEIVNLSKQIEKLRGQKEKEQMKQSMTPTQEMEYFLFEDGCVSGERYKAREKYWMGKGLWQSGYFPELEQVNLNYLRKTTEKSFDNLRSLVEYVQEHHYYESSVDSEQDEE